jgi:hypothetical protein
MFVEFPDFPGVRALAHPVRLSPSSRRSCDENRPRFGSCDAPRVGRPRRRALVR